MNILPPIFDTIPELGANKLRPTCLQQFLHLRERFGMLTVMVNFSSFRAGKFIRDTKKKMPLFTMGSKKIMIRMTGASRVFEREKELSIRN